MYRSLKILVSQYFQYGSANFVYIDQQEHISGDGFILVADGTQRWGRYGAAGILIRHVSDEGEWFFVARRAHWTHHGGTWAIPGGALNLHESPLEAAVREFEEEVGLILDAYDLVEVHEDDHGGWSYWTHVVEVKDRFDLPDSMNLELEEARWVQAHEMHELELLHAFAETLKRLGIISGSKSNKSSE